MSIQKSRPAILIRCDRELRDNLKNLAHDNRKTLSEFLRGALTDLLEKSEVK